MINYRLSLLILISVFTSQGLIGQANAMTKERTYEIPGLAGTFSEQVYNLLIRDFNTCEFNRVILQGPPGVGKSALAKKIAEYHDVPIIILSPAYIMSKYGSGSIEKLKCLFEEAVELGKRAERERNKQCRTILFIDDINIPESDSKLRSEYTYFLNAFNMLLDKYEGNKYIVFMGATQDYDSFDLRIKDRFWGRVVNIDYPTLENRRACIIHFCGELSLLDSQNPHISSELIEYIALNSEGISLRDLKMFLYANARMLNDINDPILKFDRIKRNLGHLKMVIEIEKNKKKSK